ncbi:hypothetical protein DFH07DRAFT_927701 [Mycena maculata]|uniref:F-box domain-containing protein n=1 Tax=Mycena maculata TaxID=230809 RepID=A0AAD7MYT9_9AGAR|nr:hypothetical protein DFH07DRAFT_927701 [Mycena maculata]
MHRCLLIPEIVCMICEQIYIHDTARTLTLLARTAKTFLYALDLLWKEQHGLAALLKCMPPDLWETEERVDSVREGETDAHPPTKTLFVGLRRPILPSDLDRFLFYSRRVRVFIVHDEINVAVDDLRACLADQILFPSLTTLVWGHADSFCDLPLYLGPHLKHIGFALNNSAPHLCLLLTLTLQYPMLKSVDICLPPSASTAYVVSDAVCGLRAVTRLTVNTLTTPALLHLAALPDLNVLNLMCVGDVRVPEPLPDERFVRLEHLSAGAADIEHCTALLRFLSAAPLKTTFFALSDSDGSPPSAWASFTSALRDHCVPCKLQSIFIYHGSLPDAPFPRAHTPAAPSGAALTPLLAFHNLTSLVIEPPHGLELDEGLLRDMAAAWPLMEKLVLGVSGSEVEPFPRSTTVSLRALLPFALHCPNLQTLGVVFDATLPFVGMEPELAKLNGGHRALRRLLLGHSAIADPHIGEVAKFLDGLFPCLEAMVCARGETLVEAWRRVGQAMSAPVDSE